MRAKTRKMLCLMAVLIMAASSMMTGCGKDPAKTSGSEQSQVSAVSTDTSPDSSEDTSGLTGSDSQNESQNTTSDDGTTSKTASVSSGIGNSSGAATSSKTSSTQNNLLKGYKFTYATAYPHQYVAGSSTIASHFSTLFNQIQKKYGCTIELKNYYNPTTVTNDINTAINSGVKVADIIEVPVVTARNLAKAGALANQKTVKGLDLNNGNFEKVITDGFTFNNKVYASALHTSSFQGVFFNIDIINKYAKGTDVYKLYNSGKWTWDAFRDLAIKTTVDTNNDNKKDIYGFTSNTTAIGIALSSSAGGTAIRVGNSIRMVMCDQSGINALNWMKKMYKDDKVYKYYTDWKDAETAFTEGQAAMFPFYVWSATQDFGSLVDFDYGFVPFPKETESSKHKASIYDCSVYVMTRTNKDLDKTGVIYNEISAVSSKLKSEMISALEDAGIGAEGIKAYNDLKALSVMDFSPGVDLGTYSPQVDNTVFQSAKQPTAVINSIRTAMQKACDDYYSQFK